MRTGTIDVAREREHDKHAVKELALLIRKFDDASDDAFLASARSGDAELYLADQGKGGLTIQSDASSGAADATAAKTLFSSGRFGRDGGDWLFHVGLWTPADFREEFLAWYSIEHLPILLECPTWDGCRFVEQQVADGCQFYAMHQLAERSALDSEQRKASRDTAWFKRLKAHDWFDEAFTRALYRRG